MVEGVGRVLEAFRHYNKDAGAKLMTKTIYYFLDQNWPGQTFEACQEAIDQGVGLGWLRRVPGGVMLTEAGKAVASRVPDVG